MSHPTSKTGFSMDWLKSPLTILTAVGIGVLIGLVSKRTAHLLAPIGQMYLFFLQMCVLPILVAAVVSSVGKLVRTRDSGISIGKMTLAFLGSLLLVSLVGLLFGVIGRPGADLDTNTRASLGRIANTSQYAPDLEISLAAPERVVEKKPVLQSFLEGIVPNNIFSALSSGRALEVVFFSVLLGIAIGFIRNQSSDLVLQLSDSFFDAFQRLIRWALYGLAPGLICLVSEQVASVGPQVFLAMVRFILLFAGAVMLVFCASTLVIWKRSGLGFIASVRATLDPVIISLVTRNSFATLPSAIQAAEKNLGYDRTAVNLYLPLSTTLGRVGNILYFSIAAFFVAQLYDRALGPFELLTVFAGAIFAGLATAGASGIVTLGMISIVLGPLGLPVEAVLVIFMAVDPMVDALRVLLNVHVNIAAATLVLPKAAPPAAETLPAAAAQT